VRVTEPIPPPADLDAASKAEWKLHMQLCVAAGTLSVTDLRSFRALCEAAALTARAYKEAMKTGPVLTTEQGAKTHPSWSAWSAASGKYRQWVALFGLAPVAGQHIAPLPAPRAAAKLSVVA
jgi:P27 family predicted phage terminase small subunit